MFAKDFDECNPRSRGESPGGFWSNFQDGGEGFGSFRAKRGMMESAILGALGEKPMHGYEIISYLEKRSHGMWRPSPGSVYPTLQLLEEKDLVEHDELDGKKTYRLTTEGEKEAATYREHLRTAFDHFADSAKNEGKRMNFRHEYQRHFHKQIGESMKLMRTIFRRGNVEQKRAMDDALTDLREKLEQIIGEESAQ